MFPILSKALMVSLLCLTFIGQAMSSTIMPYQMINMKAESSQEQSHNMAMMNHNSDKMVMGTEGSSQDCCVNDCHCVVGGCSTLAVLFKTAYTDLNIDSSPKIHYLASFILSQRLSSLYRPPILS